MRWPSWNGRAPARPGTTGALPDASALDHAAARVRMVDEQLVARGITDERVLAAMRRVPRERFVLPEDLARAHDDGPLAIGYGQTLSQPFIVALMSQALELAGGERVLEIGAGSGYQSALLAALAREVFALELLPPLRARAAGVLAELGCANVCLRAGDGRAGWPEAAPFDAILAAAAAERVPPAWLTQLAPGGRLLLPVGTRQQELLCIRRTSDGFVEQRLGAVRFVPLLGTERDVSARP